MTSRVVWLDGALVDPSTAAVSIDDPGMHSGVGLFETMRAADGTIPWLDRHMARLTRSIDALGLHGMPRLAAVAQAAVTTASTLGTGSARVRVTVTPHPTLLVEAVAIALDPHETLTAASVRGVWHPANRLAEHKTLSFLGWRDAQRRAHALGADTALMLDEAGRLGEASSANVFCVIDGRILTAPTLGLLPGVTRSAVMELAPVHEVILDEPAWRGADEMFVTSAVRGIVPIVRCDDTPVGTGAHPVATRLRSRIEAMLSGAGQFPRSN